MFFLFDKRLFLIYIILDSIILSNNEFLTINFETDYSKINISLIIKCDFNFLYVTDSDSFGSGTIFSLTRSISDYRCEDSNNNSVPNNAKL
jgi:hypothetical protein